MCKVWVVERTVYMALVQAGKIQFSDSAAPTYLSKPILISGNVRGMQELEEGEGNF